MAKSYFVDPKEVDQVEMLPGIHRRTLATTDEAMICEFFLERGAELPLHSHPNDQVGYVVSGKIEMTIDREIRICKSGDNYGIPRDVMYSARRYFGN